MVDCHAMIGHTDVMRVDSTLYTSPGRQRYVTPLVSQLVIVGSVKDLKNITTDPLVLVQGRMSR